MRRVLSAVNAVGVTATLGSAALVCALVAPAAAVPARTAEGAGAAGVTEAFEKHPFPTHEYGLDHPAAATYVDGPGLLAVAEQRAGGSEVVMLRPEREAVVGRMTVPGLSTPQTLADDGHGTLAALDGDTLFTWAAAARGPATVRERTVVGQSVTEPAGMTYDESSKQWLVLDSERERIVVLDAQGATVQATDGPSLADLDATSLQGIAADDSGQIYVADAEESLIYEVTADGEKTQTYDVSGMNTQTLSSMSFGETADPTDSPTKTSLYTTQSGGGTSFGLVSEVSLEPMGATALAAPLTSSGTLVKASNLYQLSPSSPDPSGIVYMSDLQRLFVADSEVDEMTIYAGVNMWQIGRDGSTQYDTGTTLKFSKEPTGIGYDPVGKRVFISDDDKGRVFQVLAGGDNRFGTADDPVTSFSATAFGDDDLEDVTFDTKTGDLFLTQGVGAEVWRVSPGANKIFDGIAPGGDDQVSHFDVGVYGIVDLEGVGYSPTRDSLFLADRTYPQILEVTKTGELVQSIDVAGLNMPFPAAITLAPSTKDPKKTSLYVTTRGVDNDNHPDENDGMMFEISAPYLAPTETLPNTAPVVSAGPDSTVNLPSAAILRGSVSDDGLPNPPGFTTSTWTMAKGPAKVVFADASAPETTVSFTKDGTYTLRLTATDGEKKSQDDVKVVVRKKSSTNTAPSVYAGSDQSITLPASASLSGFVTDDALPSPPAATTVTWSKVSGPGTVSFADPASVKTLASFGTAGTYVLRLTASDSALSSSDDVTVVVDSAPATGNLVRNPGFETDTNGWRGSAGVNLNRVQTPHTGSWSGELVNASGAATTCRLNDSPNWMQTTQPATYQVSAWVKGDAAGAGSTVRLALDEYVDTTRVGSKEVEVTLTEGWQKLETTYAPASPGSSWLDFNVVRPSTPDGAVCFLADDLYAAATSGPANAAPTVSAGADQTVTLPGSASLSGTVDDDGLPNPPGAVTVSWSKVSGPGTVSFADPGSASTTASFGAAGTYVLRLSASDSELSTSDDVTVVVEPEAAVGNLIGNPGFETDTTGWKGSTGVTVTRVAVPHTGDWSGQLTNTNNSSTTCRLNDSPNWLPSTQAGTYVLRAWVKGDAAGVGSTVRLDTYEYVGSTRVGSQSVQVSLTEGWQMLEMSYVPASPGSSWLDFNVVRPSTPAGAVCFFADDLYAGTS